MAGLIRPPGAPLRAFQTADDLGRTLGARIADGLVAAAGQERPYVLGLPSGRTAQPTLRALVRIIAAGDVDTRTLVIALMDEYAVLVDGDGDDDGDDAGGVARLRDADPGVHFSCRGFVRRQLQDPLAAAGHPVADERVLVPSAADPRAYDDQVAASGGIDLFLLASGATDGHVGFNPPGTPLDAGTRVVELADATRRDNLATFPDFGGIDDVPRSGTTIGPAGIAGWSRSAVLVVTGAGKRTAASRVLEATAYDPAWPATVVHACREAEVWMDGAALGDGRELGEERAATGCHGT